MWSIRPAAAMRFAPPCSTAWSAAGRWNAAPASETGSARSRSPAAVGKIMCWIARSSRPDPRTPQVCGNWSEAADHGPPPNLRPRHRSRRRLGRDLGRLPLVLRQATDGGGAAAEEERPEPAVLAAADGTGQEADRGAQEGARGAAQAGGRDGSQPQAHPRARARAAGGREGRGRELGEDAA